MARDWHFDMPCKAGDLPLANSGEDCYSAYIRCGRVTVGKFFMPVCSTDDVSEFYWQRLKKRCEIVCNALNVADADV